MRYHIRELLCTTVLIALHILMVCIMIVQPRTIPGGMLTFMGTLPLLMLVIDIDEKKKK